MEETPEVTPRRLTDLITVVPPPKSTEEPEDIFAASLGLIFTDDIRSQHGDPGATIVYRSRRFGDIKLETADPEGEEERKLFSHYLWNSGVLMAEKISQVSVEGERDAWNVNDARVLELGAGVGLAGIVSVLADAELVTISDYPSPSLLANIKHNVAVNLRRPPVDHSQELLSRVSVEGHEWGSLTTPFAHLNTGRYTRLLVSDCLWMTHQHLNLIRSMLHFLSVDPAARVLCIAGFHTGRPTLIEFFDMAEKEGLGVEEIWEEHAEGHKREWSRELRRGGEEDVWERNKWVVCAVMKR
ncbi:hypothetical protein LTR66_013426 [Elasticomyces elasticus]|nr:hypothetical protein LTR66_013426 [Elasticomyces elasticus]